LSLLHAFTLITVDTDFMRAIWKDQVIAESDHTIEIEVKHYIPAESLKREHLHDSTRQPVCPWTGTASYYDVVVGEEINPAATWNYPEPRTAAESIRGHVAFWRRVVVHS
jgi:uncharacterized protein (DUF427 family)